jgi:hypothetical protein
MTQVERIIEVAKSWVGYCEKKRGTYTDAQLRDKAYAAGSDNYTLFGAWYKLQGGKWCAMFLSFVANEAGVPTGTFPKFADCDVGRAWFSSRGQWWSRPEPGDIVFFGVTGDAQHVGLVTSYDGKTVRTCEGNTSGAAGMVANGGCVAEKSYSVYYEKILGYGRPKYKGDDIVTYEDFKAYMERYETEKRSQPVSPWAKGAWDKLTDAGVFDGTAPRAELTREQAAALIERLGLLK